MRRHDSATTRHRAVTVHVEVRVRRRRRRHPYVILWMIGPVHEQDLPGPVLEVPMTPLTETQYVDCVITPLSKKGNPSKIEPGSSVFASTDMAIVSAAPDPADPTNELKVRVLGVAPGQASVTWTARNLAGQPVTPAKADFTVDIGLAVSGAFAIGTPTEL